MIGYNYKPSEYIVQNVDSYITLSNMPKRSDWQCEVIGGPMGLVFVPTKGNEPNWFHRKMQELCFGFKWRKKC